MLVVEGPDGWSEEEDTNATHLQWPYLRHASWRHEAIGIIVDETCLYEWGCEIRLFEYWPGREIELYTTTTPLTKDMRQRRERERRYALCDKCVLCVLLSFPSLR